MIITILTRESSIAINYTLVNFHQWCTVKQTWAHAFTPPTMGTVVSIVSRRWTYCCLETSHGKITRYYSWYCTVAFCYVHKCELSCPICVLPCPLRSWYKTASPPSEIISNRVCGIWLGIGEGANVIISKYVIWLDSGLLRFCNWSVLLWTVLRSYRVT